MKIDNKKYNEKNCNLLKYYAEIKQGNIIVGRELTKELDNLVNDLKYNDEYFYDTKAAEERFYFMEKFIRLTKSPYYNKPLKLMLWQKAFIEVLYSFKMTKEYVDNKKIIDRFKKALLLIARKNCKSETCSALGNAEFILGEDGSDLVCSSNDDRQASIVYDAINTMRSMYDPNDVFSKKNQRFILRKDNGTKIFKLSQKTRNKEGHNISWAILDESHELKDDVIAKSIEQSQSLKENPKMIEITTNGFVNDGHLDNELKRARAIINQEDTSIASKRYLPWLYTQDSEQEIFTNKKSWFKSNPTLGIIKKFDYLEEQVELAKESKSDRIFVLSKDFNIKQSNKESWLNEEDYIYNSKYNIEDLENSFCLGHVDLAETTDLCCAKVLILKGNIKYIITKYFIPESKLERENDDHFYGANYKEWAKQGYIQICEGNDIDLSIVARWFLNLKRDYNINLYKCGYDQKFSNEFLKTMEDFGWSKKYGDLEIVLQNSQTLNNALLLCEKDLKSRLINYNENPVDRWCFSNSVLKINSFRQGMLIKNRNGEKIDGAVTLVSLYEMYRRYRSELKTISERK